jgi:Putative ATP-binding cassette
VRRSVGGSIGLGLLLWRAQFFMFLNQTVKSRQAGRIVATVAGAAVILLAWSWEVIVALLIVNASRRIAMHVDLVSLLSLAFFGYTAVLIFSSLIFSLNALLLNPDLELLLATPRSVESILGGRMVVQVLRLMLLGLLFTGPALLVFAIANQNPVLPLAFAVLYLLYPVFIVVIISLLSLLLVRIIPAGRGRELVTIFGVLLALGINILNFLVNPALRGSSFGPRPRGVPSLPNIPLASAPWLPSGWAGRAAAAIIGGDWLSAIGWIALLLAVSVILFAVGAALSGRLYLAGWIQAVPPRRRSPRAARTRTERRLPLLDPVLASIVIKDWRMRTRDIAQLVRFIMPVVFLVIIFGLRFPRLLSAVQNLGPGPVAAMLGLLPAWILLFSLAISLGLTAVSLEGKSIWVYAASPNTTLRFLQGKCWSTALPTVAVVAILATAAEVLIRPGWVWAVGAIAVGVALAAGISTLMVGIGALFARFDWTDVRRMMNPIAAFIGMALFSVISLGTVLLFGISLALAGALRLPMFSVWVAAMALAVGATMAVAALGLLAGNQRLRGLELG